MLLLALILSITAALAVEQETSINNHIVLINGDKLISVYPTLNGSIMLNLSGLGLRSLAENAFDNLTALKNLDLGNNSLFSIPKQLFSKLRNLEHLSLANNNLTHFNKIFEGLDHLKTLNISNNPLNRLEATALSGLPKSSVVYTKGLSFKYLNAFVFENDTTTTFKTSKFNKRSINLTRQDPNRLMKICIDKGVLTTVNHFENYEILPKDCRRRILPVGRHTMDLRNLGIEKLKKGWYQMSKPTPIMRILLNENNISQVTPALVNYLPSNVRSISLGDNKIKLLKKDILRNTHIWLMDFRSNAICDIEDNTFTNMDHLIGLFLDDNVLNSTRFMATLPAEILELSVSGNKITDVSLCSSSTISKLRLLRLNRNLIQEVKSDSFNCLPDLEKLELSANLISKIEPQSFQQLSQVNLINLKNNIIVTFENGTFDNQRNLKRLDVSYNKLSDIKKSFQNSLPPNLVTLNLGFNVIEKLESDNFKNIPLEILILSGNKISEIEFGVFKLPTLRKLRLANNNLTQLRIKSFRGLRNMRELNLAHNNITRIPKRFTRNMDSLKKLILSYNPIHRLQNSELYGFRKTAFNNVFLNKVPIEIIEGGLFDYI